jgi:hypothetical protein
LAELWEISKLIRSKNAGPWDLTIDLMFDNKSNYDLVAASPLSAASTYSELYKIDEGRVRVFLHPTALAIKVTIPRPTPAGALTETDVFGGQFHSPLVRFEIPAAVASAEGGAQ